MSMRRVSPLDAEIIINAVFEHGLAKLKKRSPTLFAMVCEYRDDMVKSIAVAKKTSNTAAYRSLTKYKSINHVDLPAILKPQAE